MILVDACVLMILVDACAVLMMRFGPHRCLCSANFLVIDAVEF